MTHPLILIEAAKNTYRRFEGRTETHGFLFEKEVDAEMVEKMRLYPEVLETEEVA